MVWNGSCVSAYVRYTIRNYSMPSVIGVYGLNIVRLRYSEMGIYTYVAVKANNINF